MRNEYPDPANIVKATFFAARKHQNQRRKGVDAAPYINHPLAVAYVLAVEAGIKDETVIIAALLHDTVEDTDTTFEELKELFGEKIRQVVGEVTDDKSLEKGKRKDLQIQHAPTMSPAAKQIKIADKICNIRDITNAPPTGWSIERKLEYLKWTSNVVIGCRGVSKRLEDIYDATLKTGLEKLKLD
jgi:guanosine-3',5'-bis(diphosphate) 3'-pyrophosphohydrolase